MSAETERNEIRRNIGIEPPRKGVLYAVNGVVSSPDGRYYIRYQDRSTDLLKARGSFQAEPGVQVLTRFDPDTRQYVIVGQDMSVRGSASSGVFTGNALDPRNTPPRSSRSMSDLLARVVGAGTMKVTVGGVTSPVYYQENWYPFPGAQIDMTSYVPTTASKKVVVVIGYYPPFGKLYAMSSSEVDASLVTGSAQIDEAWEARKRDMIPVAAVTLVAGQTALAPSDLEILRQLVNVPPQVGYPNPVTGLMFVPPGRTLLVASGLRLSTEAVLRLGHGAVLKITR